MKMKAGLNREMLNGPLSLKNIPRSFKYFHKDIVFNTGTPTQYSDYAIPFKPRAIYCLANDDYGTWAYSFGSAFLGQDEATVSTAYRATKQRYNTLSVENFSSVFGSQESDTSTWFLWYVYFERTAWSSENIANISINPSNWYNNGETEITFFWSGGSYLVRVQLFFIGW